MSSWLDTNMNSYVNFGADLGAIFNAIKNPTNPLFVALGILGFAANTTTSRIGKGKIMSLGLSLGLTVAATAFFYYVVKTNWFHPNKPAQAQAVMAPAYTTDNTDVSSLMNTMEQITNQGMDKQVLKAAGGLTQDQFNQLSDGEKIKVLNKMSDDPALYGQVAYDVPYLLKGANATLSDSDKALLQKADTARTGGAALSKVETRKVNTLLLGLYYPGLTKAAADVIPQNYKNGQRKNVFMGSLADNALAGSVSSQGSLTDSAELALIANPKPYVAWGAGAPNASYGNPTGSDSPRPDVSYQVIP